MKKFEKRVDKPENICYTVIRKGKIAKSKTERGGKNARNDENHSGILLRAVFDVPPTGQLIKRQTPEKDRE